MAKQTFKPIAAAVGAAFIASMAMSHLALSAENPFQMTELSSGYQVADAHKDGEGKCGEGKCGEGMATDGEAKAESEGKCGEGKCGEGKCGEEGAKAHGEGKCGEAKCGEGKCGEEMGGAGKADDVPADHSGH